MASMNDVATRAGVSIATVSRVLNNNGNVNEATRAKINKAIKDLKYQPSRVAKRLRSKSISSNLLGVLIPDIENPFYVDVLRGIEELAYNNNYAIIMCNFGQDEKKEKLYLEILQSEAIDGLIVAPAREDDPLLKKMVKDGLPVVCVDRGLKDSNVDVVLVDNVTGAFTAVDYLIKSGYKRIAYIAGLVEIPSSLLREKGYRKALEANGIPFEKELVRFGDSKHKSGVELCEELLKLTNPPDAIFTGNNLITLGALETIHKRKLRIPEDIAIVGFDDMQWSSSLNPPLTAVRQPAIEIGKRAVELLIQRIQDPERSCIQMTLNTQLIERSSS
ncbi:LacI family DNA-binding transcriptional regulator [Prolixibacteraceae bacterium Z1-6]|uniref:LacI family DNA-binding transcriptional regulator n=1 Tax=Draconibacterium aestuarii TaxID=2998507 RepID=A0A9X3F7K1_9BACT|nr:LacI family DNA-binding transcriptional regulator [Prolixibacteraceae bacterium Z1-6]